uniref:uncharacterized protein LOC108950889 n=1 Tax=Ciona intestinalis TaxID=7719 RepID=UPI00089DC166|nr:uncharacterized protein LOC108950889 [Ciona intestinalis]|eukprot:XP_018672681.1 uncharacterized protein LOC108950889 [Ciona intestinalis]
MSAVEYPFRRSRNGQRRLGMLRNCYPRNVVLGATVAPGSYGNCFNRGTALTLEQSSLFTSKEKMEKLRQIRSENAKAAKYYQTKSRCHSGEEVLDNCTALNLIRAAETTTRYCSTAPSLGTLFPVELTTTFANETKEDVNQIYPSPSREASAEGKSYLEKLACQRNCFLPPDYYAGTRISKLPYMISTQKVSNCIKSTGMSGMPKKIQDPEAVIRLVKQNSKFTQMVGSLGGNVGLQRIHSTRRSSSAQKPNSENSKYIYQKAVANVKRVANDKKISQPKREDLNIFPEDTKPKSNPVIIWPRRPLNSSRGSNRWKGAVIFDQEPLGIVGANCHLSVPLSPRPSSKRPRAFVESKQISQPQPPRGGARASHSVPVTPHTSPRAYGDIVTSQQCRCKLDSRTVKFSCCENTIHEFESDQPVTRSYNATKTKLQL